VSVNDGTRVVIDVRHCNPDETVLCAVAPSCERWSQFVVTSETRWNGLRGKKQHFFCRAHLEGFLTLADGIGVG